MRADAEHRREKERMKRGETEPHPGTSPNAGCANLKPLPLHPSR